MSVNGDRAVKQTRLAPDTGAPVVTAGASTSTFSGPSGSVSASVSFRR